MDYSVQIANKLVSYMEEKGYRYEFDRDEGIMQLDFSIQSSVSRVRFLIDIRSHHFITYGGIDLRVQEGRRTEVAEYLTRANYGLIFGNFELDMRDGEIRYKCAVDCDHCLLSDEMIGRSLDVPIFMYQRYGDNMMKVMLGMLSAEEAICLAESDV